MGKMLIMTVEMWDGYQRFIILSTLLGYMFENVRNRRLQEHKKRRKKKCGYVCACGACSLLLWMCNQFRDL